MYGSSNGGGTEGTARRSKITAPALRARKGGDAIVMVTAYDFTMARLLDQAGVDVLLVGDSVGMVVQGHQSTLPVTLEEIAYHTRAVARGAEGAHVVADMPFMSFQLSAEQALASAGRLVKEAGAESVKLEGGEDVCESVRRISRAGIPVMGHVGLTPQSVHALGGYRVQGRGDAAERVLADAIALDEAGAYAIVLEAVPPDLGARITAAVRAPTIGIGAGPACDGQVLVCHDLCGMTLGHTPKFAKRFAEVGEAIRGAAASFAREVRAGSFPGPEHCYKPNAAPDPEAAPRAPASARGRRRLAVA
jgi:3-methyl-2-oxobutanoate hydroxymethyltransferase